jgi:hypothetical protein
MSEKIHRDIKLDIRKKYTQHAAPTFQPGVRDQAAHDLTIFSQKTGEGSTQRL